MKDIIIGALVFIIAIALYAAFLGMVMMAAWDL